MLNLTSEIHEHRKDRNVFMGRVILSLLDQARRSQDPYLADLAGNIKLDGRLKAPWKDSEYFQSPEAVLEGILENSVLPYSEDDSDRLTFQDTPSGMSWGVLVGHSLTARVLVSDYISEAEVSSVDTGVQFILDAYRLSRNNAEMVLEALTHAEETPKTGSRTQVASASQEEEEEAVASE